MTRGSYTKFGSIPITSLRSGPEALNPVLVLGMLPLFDQVISPYFQNRGFSLDFIRRMWMSIALSVVFFPLSGVLHTVMDTNPSPNSEINSEKSQISILWQLPQSLLVTACEILFCITNLKFSYQRAPSSMKSVVQSISLFTVAAGNLVTVIIVVEVGDSLYQANEQVFFAFLAAVAVLVMITLGSGFVHKNEDPLLDPEENPRQYDLIFRLVNLDGNYGAYLKQNSLTSLPMPPPPDN